MRRLMTVWGGARGWGGRLCARIQAIWGVISARRVVVLTYDDRLPANKLGTLYLCAPCNEVVERLENATLIAKKYDTEDSEKGQEDSLNTAKKLLGI